MAVLPCAKRKQFQQNNPPQCKSQSFLLSYNSDRNPTLTLTFILTLTLTTEATK